ncbi:hypothetical protein ACFW93_41675 [Streptomyces canus]|uniref:hypothetical protein n=1 Tax=Streptomyces canus TaxID=58343 RepID=UPI00369A6E6B
MTGRPSVRSRSEAIRRIARSSVLPRALAPGAEGEPPARILVLTPPGHEEDACAALRAGVDQFRLDDAAPGELTAAIRVVAAGGAVIPRP